MYVSVCNLLNSDRVDVYVLLPININTQLEVSLYVCECFCTFVGTQNLKMWTGPLSVSIQEWPSQCICDKQMQAD